MKGPRGLAVIDARAVMALAIERAKQIDPDMKPYDLAVFLTQAIYDAGMRVTWMPRSG